MGLIYCFLFNGCCTLAYVSHIRAAFADPGRIALGMKAPFESKFTDMNTCEKCPKKKTWKPARAHHCRECGFCVFKMDHHCPWINNCVGHRNMKYFLQFVGYIMLSSAMLCFFCIMSFYYLINCKDSRELMENSKYFKAFLGNIFAFVEGCLFCYFTYDLLSDHLTSIDDNQSYIDELKK